VCTQVCPEVFILDDEAGVAKVSRSETADLAVLEAEKSCPVSCIRTEAEF
jgi:ferredoxin